MPKPVMIRLKKFGLVKFLVEKIWAQNIFINFLAEAEMCPSKPYNQPYWLVGWYKTNKLAMQCSRFGAKLSMHEGPKSKLDKPAHLRFCICQTQPK